MPARRTVLATVATVVGAGCLTPAGDSSPTDEPPGETSPGGSPTDYVHTGGPRSPEGCSSGFDVKARQVDSAEWFVLRLDDARRALVVEVVETGTATIQQYSDYPPVPDGAYVEHEGRYYETAVSQVGRTDVPAVVTDVEWEKGQEAPGDAEVVAFADLPTVDRAALRFAVEGERFGEQHGHPEEGLGVRDAPIPYPDGTDDSVLVGGETWVRWNDRTYRVETDGGTTVTRHQFRFRITVSEVADGPDAFRALVAERHLLVPSELSDGEREVLETAVGGTYEACEDDEGVARLRERLSEDDQLPPPRNAAWYVQFEGTRYALTIYRWAH